MIKQALLLFQFFIFLLFGVAPGNVTVEQKAPATIEPGEEFTVEITINKGEVGGFAKVQQILPEGFTAKAQNTNGATFSYSNRKVKFIWMALPSDNDFTISYKVQPDENFTGEFKLDGKFAYIEDNERMEISIPPSTIKVGGDDELAEETPADEEEGDVGEEEEESSDEGEEDVDEEGEEEITQEDEGEEEVAEETGSEEEESPATEEIDVEADRSIGEETPGTFLVTLKLNKGSLEGFAKAEDNLPDGFKAVEVNSDGGVFSYNENEQMIKVLWMSLPGKEVLEIKYKLIAETAAPDNYDVSGKFAYLEGDISKTLITDATEFTLEKEAEPLAEDTSEGDDQRASVEDEDDAGADDIDDSDVSNIPAPESGVNYKVQVAASHKNVANDYFRQKYKLRTPVSMIRHEGWNKYLTGEYNVYKQARDRRNEIWNVNNINDAFVTAYNSGNRITVQEALMITNQEWVK